MARPGLRIHPKFRRLVHILGVPEAHAVGYLECLWMVAYENGDPVVGDALDVELAAGWPGERGALCRALVEVRFLDVLDEGRYGIHDLFDHAPEYVIRRAAREAARRENGLTLSEVRAAAGKKGGLASGAARKQAEANDSNCPPFASRHEANGATPAPAPAPTREEVSSLGLSSCSEPDKPASDPTQQPLITFPVVGKEKTWGLLPSKLAEFQEAFPTLDVLAECRKALAWLQQTPTKRKTSRGMGRFLFGWLSRSQDTGHGRAASPATPPAETEAERLARIQAQRERARREEEEARASGGLQALAEGRRRAREGGPS